MEIDSGRRATSPDVKPEVEFQYGGRLFFLKPEVVTSYISAVD